MGTCSKEKSNDVPQPPASSLQVSFLPSARFSSFSSPGWTLRRSSDNATTSHASSSSSSYRLKSRTGEPPTSAQRGALPHSSLLPIESTSWLLPSRRPPNLQSKELMMPRPNDGAALDFAHQQRLRRGIVLGRCS